MITLPIIVPATPETTYDEWFYTNFKCENMHQDDLATLSFDRVPRNSVSKELLHSATEAISRPFWPLVTPGDPAYNEDAAAAMQAVLTVLPQLV